MLYPLCLRYAQSALALCAHLGRLLWAFISDVCLAHLSCIKLIQRQGSCSLEQNELEASELSWAELKALLFHRIGVFSTF